jgi:hypothetical protein
MNHRSRSRSAGEPRRARRHSLYIWREPRVDTTAERCACSAPSYTAIGAVARIRPLGSAQSGQADPPKATSFGLSETDATCIRSKAASLFPIRATAQGWRPAIRRRLLGDRGRICGQRRYGQLYDGLRLRDYGGRCIGSRSDSDRPAAHGLDPCDRVSVLGGGTLLALRFRKVLQTGRAQTGGRVRLGLERWIVAAPTAILAGRHAAGEGGTALCTSRSLVHRGNDLTMPRPVV